MKKLKFLVSYVTGHSKYTTDARVQLTYFDSPPKRIHFISLSVYKRLKALRAEVINKSFLDEVELRLSFKGCTRRRGHSYGKGNHNQRLSPKQGLALTYKRKQDRSGHQQMKRSIELKWKVLPRSNCRSNQGRILEGRAGKVSNRMPKVSAIC